MPEFPALRVDSRLPLTARFNRHFVHDGPPKAFASVCPRLTISRLIPGRVCKTASGGGDPSRKWATAYRREIYSCASYRQLSAHLARPEVRPGPGDYYPWRTAGDYAVFRAAARRAGRHYGKPCHWAAAGVFSCLGLNIKAINVDDEGFRRRS